VTGEMKDLIGYRLERARETLEEAELLLRNGHANTFVNRLYYACYYAVSAWLLLKGLSTSKHSGVRSYVHQYLVKPGIIDTEQGVLYDLLFNNRQKADYVDMVHFDEGEVAPWLDQAKTFVNTVNTLIEKNGISEEHL